MMLPFFVSLLLFVGDQLLKWWASTSLQPVGTMPFIPGLFSLTYLENRGAAWGLFSGNKFILVGLSSIMLIVLVYILVTKKVTGKVAVWALSFIAAGGLGNVVDRVLRGYVVDYIHFLPFEFPVFNLADICVVVGSILLCVHILFFDESVKKKRVEQPSEEQDV